MWSLVLIQFQWNFACYMRRIISINWLIEMRIYRFRLFGWLIAQTDFFLLLELLNTQRHCHCDCGRRGRTTASLMLWGVRLLFVSMLMRRHILYSVKYVTEFSNLFIIKSYQEERFCGANLQ